MADTGKEDLVLSNTHLGVTRLIHNLDKENYRLLTKRLSKINVSHTQALVIIYLHAHRDRDVYQVDLEQAFGVKNSTMTISIKSMIIKGFVHKERSNKDKRFFSLSLTDAGKQIYPFCTSVYAEVDAMYSSFLDPEEEKVFRTLSRKIAQKLAQFE